MKTILKPKLLTLALLYATTIATALKGTLLHHIVWQNDADAIHTAIAAGADVNARDHIGKTPLHEAALWGLKVSARTLLALGVKVDDTDRQGCTPLHLAASYSHTKVVQLLIKKGANVNACDRLGHTPLHCAATAPITRLLLEAGADASTVDSYNKTPAMRAAHYANHAVLHALLEAGITMKEDNEHSFCKR